MKKYCFVCFALVMSMYFFVSCQIHRVDKEPLHPDTSSTNSGEDTNALSLTLLETLPESVTNQIYWFCDYEDQTFRKWEDEGTEDFYAGGGIFLTDEPNVSYGIVTNFGYSGNYCSFSMIQNAITPGDNKAVRFMRWTDKAWDHDGDYFPDEAYYSAFFMFSEVYNPKKPSTNDPYEDGGWWNVFQFKSDNNAGSQPVVIMDLYNEGGKMYFGLIIKDFPDDNSDDHTQTYHTQSTPMEIPAGEWVHFEMYLKKNSDYHGVVTVWQNGTQIFHQENVRTVLPPAETATWGIGNYTDYVTGGREDGKALIYYDDAIIAPVRISEYLNP